MVSRLLEESLKPFRNATKSVIDGFGGEIVLFFFFFVFHHTVSNALIGKNATMCVCACVYMCSNCAERQCLLLGNFGGHLCGCSHSVASDVDICVVRDL